MEKEFINQTEIEEMVAENVTGMPKEEQIELIKKWREKRLQVDRDKIDKLVLPLITHCAAKLCKDYADLLKKNYMEFNEILSECWLIHSNEFDEKSKDYEKYDIERGVAYTTYLWNKLLVWDMPKRFKRLAEDTARRGKSIDEQAYTGDEDTFLVETIADASAKDPEEEIITKEGMADKFSVLSPVEMRVAELKDAGYEKNVDIINKMTEEGFNIDEKQLNVIRKKNLRFKMDYIKDMATKTHERGKLTSPDLKSHPIHFWTEDYSKMEEVDWTCRDNSVVGIIEELKRIDSHTISEYLEKYIEDNFIPRMREELRLELNYFIESDKKNKRAEKSLTDNYLEYACKKYYDSEFYRKTVGPGLVYGITRCTLFKVVCGIIDLQNDSFFNGPELLSVLLEKACGERDVYFKDPYEVMVYYCLYNKYSNGYYRTYDKVIELTQVYEDSFKSGEYKDIIEPEFTPDTATVKYSNWWKDEISKGMSEEELIKHLIIKTKHFKWVQDVVEKNQMRENGLKETDESELLEEKIRVSKKKFHEWEVASPKSKTMTAVYNALVQESKTEWDYILTKNKVSNNDLMAILKMYGDAETGKKIEDLDVIVKKHAKWFDKGCRIGKNDFVKSSGNVQNNLTRNHIITMVFLLYCAYIKNDTKCKDMSPEEWYIDYCDMVNNELVKCDLMPFYRPHIYEAFITVCILSGAPLYNYTKAMELLKKGIEK